MSDDELEPEHSVKDMILGVLPGLASVKVGGAAFLAVVLTIVLWASACELDFSLKGRMTLGVGGLLVWAHAVGWLLTGELRVLTSSLADLEGGMWIVFGGMVTVPACVAWGVFGSIVG